MSSVATTYADGITVTSGVFLHPIRDYE
jgi:hypothetical protein